MIICVGRGEGRKCCVHDRDRGIQAGHHQGRPVDREVCPNFVIIGLRTL